VLCLGERGGEVRCGVWNGHAFAVKRSSGAPAAEAGLSCDGLGRRTPWVQMPIASAYCCAGFYSLYSLSAGDLKQALFAAVQATCTRMLRSRAASLLLHPSSKHGQ